MFGKINNLQINFDQREAFAYHIFIQSFIKKSVIPFKFLTLSMNLLSIYYERYNNGVILLFILDF